MKYEPKAPDRWERHFALFPIIIEIDNEDVGVWLQWYWKKREGAYRDYHGWVKYDPRKVKYSLTKPRGK